MKERKREEEQIKFSVFCTDFFLQLDDPAGCEAGLNAHWADIANAMYPVFLEGTSVCGQLSVCYVREWTCEECVDGVGQIAGIISDSATVEAVIAFLKVGHIMSVASVTNLIF